MAGTVEGATSTASAVVRCDTCGAKNRVPPVAEGVRRCGKCHNPLPWIVPADDSSFDAVAVGARLPVLVDLWATWCGPCRAVSPALEQVARRLAGRLKLVKVEVDTSPAQALEAWVEQALALQ